MHQDQIIRAWKEPSFRAGLDGQALAALPASPAGSIELSTDDLMDTQGGSVLIAISISLTIPAVTTLVSKALSE